VIVEVFHQHLTQSIDLCPDATLDWSNDVSFELSFLDGKHGSLFFEISKQPGELADDSLVTVHAGILVDDQSKVEDELVPVILFGVDDAYRMADDAETIGANGDELVAEFLPRDDVVRDGSEVEQRRLGGFCWRWND